MTTFTERDIQRNMRSVAHAIAQQELEGLEVPAATVADLHRAARGEDRHGSKLILGTFTTAFQNGAILRRYAYLSASLSLKRNGHLAVRLARGTDGDFHILPEEGGKELHQPADGKIPGPAAHQAG